MQPKPSLSMRAVNLSSNGNPIHFTEQTLVSTVVNEHKHSIDVLFVKSDGYRARFTVPYHSSISFDAGLGGLLVPKGSTVYAIKMNTEFSRIWRVGRCCTFMPFHLLGVVHTPELVEG